MNDKLSISTGCLDIVGGVAAFLLIVGAFMSVRIVDPGHVGLVTVNGILQDGYRAPGFYLVMPAVTNVIDVDTRIKKHDFKDISAATKEQQGLTLTGTVNYHLDAPKVHDLYKNVGLDIADKVLDAAFSDFLKETTPQFTAGTILQHRNEIRDGAKTALSANLSRYGAIVDDIYIANMAFSQQYQDAIERAQTAQQQVQEQEQITKQKTEQAKQAVAEATGLADAQIERARGEAEANRQREASVSDRLNTYLAIQKWDGRLPQVSGGNQLVNIPLGGKA